MKNNLVKPAVKAQMMIRFNNLINSGNKVKFLSNLKVPLKIPKRKMKVLIQTMGKIKMEKTIFLVLFKIILQNLILKNIY